jgi:four helix bundle protein
MQSDSGKFKIELKRRRYDFTLQLIQFIDQLPNDGVTRRLANQLLRSGTSVIANYVEGQSVSSKKDYTSYFTTSLKSGNESKVWLSLLKDTGRAKDGAVMPLLRELDEISKIFASSILTLKGSR